ncbi:FADdependent oxidoreductase [Acanthamoeba castellanii str. Neff]|uniref:FADdependent oxidoreductase n=1 Tax=Acanthamoeba castellanii (strain ATCC 30010 / Neff) TaxID=1257118 RepID=L8GK00_ACACF|nr:FADdependent oxidoreductase [Acanthamoeba castellanii str. Neff]ELR13048.1 FADdependent oxidoreductase [Acanthamoeba castellanii str. Neff]
MSFVAVDESGGWMRKWDDLMHNLDVHHLRSPLNAHPDPFDVTSLNAFAHEQGRSAELQCLGISPRSSGREDKKKVRDHAAYIFTNNDRIMLKVPSVPLFKSFCQSLITRYDLDSHLVQARVIRVEPCFDAPESTETRPTTKPSSFKVHLSTGQVLRGKRVVLATGQTRPRIPSWVPEQQTTQRKGNTIIHSDWMRVNDPAFRRSIKNKVGLASRQPLIPTQPQH